MKKSTARYLLPVTGAFALVAASVLCWHYISPNRNIQKAALEVEEITRVVRQNYAKKVDYWGLNTKFIFDNNLLTNLSYSENELRNALNKPILIGHGQNGETVMPGERSFEIVYKDLSVGECIALASYRYRHPEELGLLQITIVGKEKTQTFRWGGEDYKLPITRHEAQEFCTNYSKILWTIE